MPDSAVATRRDLPGRSAVTVPALRPFRRIGLFAGPGAAKTTTALRVAGALKASGRVECELVLEVVKAWAFQGIPVRGFDQAFIVAHQIHQEDIILRASSSVVISDLPPRLGLAYARHYRAPYAEPLLDLVNAFDQAYPPLNIFLDRGCLPYSPVGRYQNYEEAVAIDRAILEQLDRDGAPYARFSPAQGSELLDFLLQALCCGVQPSATP